MSHGITYLVHVARSLQLPSVPHAEIQESACCKYKTRHAWVTKLIDAVTARDHSSRCRHRLQLQLPLLMSLIPLCSSRLRCIGHDHMGFWIWDGGRQIFMSTERSGSNGTARGGGGIQSDAPNLSVRFLWVLVYYHCLYPVNCWSDYSPLLGSGQGGSHTLSDICNVRIVQQRWGGGVLTLDCRGYRTPSLRGIPLNSWYGNMSLSRGKLRIAWRPRLFLIRTISKTSKISYIWSHVRVKALGRHSPI